MVHLRLNAKTSNPNPYINFTTALPMPSQSESDAATDLLRALAAQVKPVMKKHGFTVGSFEEYEWNRVFAGRNWNAGEVVEIVLRRPDSSFYPLPYLLSTLTHELAHITHMDHSPSFHSLWSQLRNEVLALQSRGYYGDGYWSSGHRVGDSRRVMPDMPIAADDLPEYTCGGAQTAPRSRRAPGRRRARASHPGPGQTGRQTEKRRKPGTRVKTGVFALSESGGGGAGVRLDGRGEGERGEGSTFRKRATSKKAKEERAEAAERRLRALQGLQPTKLNPSDEGEDDEESDGGGDESDDEARRRGLEALPKAERDSLRTRTRGFASSPKAKGKGKGRVVIDLTSSGDDDNDDDDGGDELPDVSDMLGDWTGPERADDDDDDDDGADDDEVEVIADDWVTLPTSLRGHAQAPGGGADGKEKGKGKRREGASASASGEGDPDPRARATKRPRPTPTPAPARALPQKKKPTSIKSEDGHGTEKWPCGVCTYLNGPGEGRCGMCESVRGREVWDGQGQGL